MFCIWILEDNKIQSNMIKDHILSYEQERQFVDEHCLVGEINIVNQHFKEEMGRMVSNSYGQHQVFIIDIDLKGEDNGLEIARKIRRKLPLCHIIFISSHIELMSQVFLYNLKVLTFIDKRDALLKERLSSALDAIVEEENSQVVKTVIRSHKDNQFLCYQYKGNYYRIAFERIMGIETSTVKRGIEIITKDKTYPSRMSMKKVMEMLPQNFIRSHKAVIVNTQHIQEIVNNRSTFVVVMNGGYKFPASQLYVTDLIKRLDYTEG